MNTMRRSSRPLLNYAAAVTVAFVGTWGVTAAEARFTPAGRSSIVPTVRAGAIVVEAIDPPPSRDSLAALLIDGDRPTRSPRGQVAMLREVIALSDQLWSASERATVLGEIAALPALDSSIVSAVAQASTKIPSPTDRARVLERLIQRHPQAVGVSRRAVLDATATMTSTSARASTLATFVTRHRLGQGALVDALSHASRLPSGERSYVLRAAARANRIEGRARAVYVQAAMSLSSRSQRSRALSAIGARYGSHEGH